MTELVFRNDRYLAACEARVVPVRGETVELDRTVFYPMGGGQPGDTGVHVMQPGFNRAPVTGGRMAEDRAHLDFDVEMEKLAKDEIEARLNELTRAGHPTSCYWIGEIPASICRPAAARA